MRTFLLIVIVFAVASVVSRIEETNTKLDRVITLMEHTAP